jgi:hypothetical protein
VSRLSGKFGHRGRAQDNAKGRDLAECVELTVPSRGHLCYSFNLKSRQNIIAQSLDGSLTDIHRSQ